MSSERKTLQKALKDALTQGGGAAQHPVVKELVAGLAESPSFLIDVQFAQLLFNDLEAVEGTENLEVGDRSFHVGRIPDNRNDTQDGVSEEWTGRQLNSDHAQFVRNIDFGMSRTSRVKHVTSLRKCSCQFHCCWGVPCRHMFAVLTRLGGHRYTYFLKVRIIA
jgi:hypothetical protein